MPEINIAPIPIGKLGQTPKIFIFVPHIFQGMEILIILLLILLNGVFAMSEIALVSARKSNLNMLAKQGDRSARRALKLAEDPDKFLSTVQIGITLIGILTGIYSGDAIADELAEVFQCWEIPYAAPVAQTLIVVVVTYLTIVFGELIPKRIGMTTAEPVAKLVAWPMQILSVVASPFVWILSKSTAGVARLFGLRQTETPVTEDEIKSMVQEGAEGGAVQKVEQKIVGRVFSLGDRTVDSIMTPRSDIAWLDVKMSVEQIREEIRQHPHGRYPVGDGSLDKVLGTVYLKDLFVHIQDEDFSLRKLVFPAKMFHEGAQVYDALEQLRTEQLGCGVVYDEFGVTQGIFTTKDIFEALVGEMLEEREEPDIIVREDGSTLIDGQCAFYDFLAHFGMEDAFPHTDYTTISGLILDKLGHIPQSGEHFRWECFSIEVVDMDGVRIDKVLVAMNQPVEA